MKNETTDANEGLNTLIDVLEAYENSMETLNISLGEYIVKEAYASDEPLRLLMFAHAKKLSAILVDSLLIDNSVRDRKSLLAEILELDYYSVRVAAEVATSEDKFRTWLICTVATNICNNITDADLNNLLSIRKLCL